MLSNVQLRIASAFSGQATEAFLSFSATRQVIMRTPDDQNGCYTQFRSHARYMSDASPGCPSRSMLNSV